MRQSHFLERKQIKRKCAHPSEICTVFDFERTLALKSEELISTGVTIGFYLYNIEQIIFLNSGFLILVSMKPTFSKS